MQSAPFINEQGDLISEEAEMAEELNTYFSSVFTREDTSTVPDPTTRSTRSKLRNCWTKKVKRKIKVPEEWRQANVIPIFKKGSKAAPSNYRPVSLTCVSCKMMESIIKDDLMLHLKRNNLINPS